VSFSFGAVQRSSLIKSDILAKTKVLEEATVRKAGGKYKMLPLFDETTAKIKKVTLRILSW
jgi:hypothetical protein